MIHLHQTTSIFLGFTKKVLTYDNGALVVIASLPSYKLVDSLIEAFKDVPMIDLFLPFIIGTISIFIYFVVFAFDFITGIRASHQEQKRLGNAFVPISSKLWSSMWKFLAVNILIMIQMLFALGFALMQVSWLNTTCLFGMITIAVAASLFDLISIGENHVRRFGTKPKIFVLLENVSSAFNNGLIKKITSLFD